jgi:hypothetical protein
MKKLLVLSCILIAATITARAQTLAFGVKAGLNFSEMTNEIPSMKGGEKATGFVGGVYGRAGILGMFVQPEVLFSQRKGAFTSVADGTAVINTLSYIDVPVLFGYKLAFARVNVGPNFQFLMGASQKGNDASKDPDFSKDNYETSGIGFQAGVGVDLMKLSLDLRYDRSITNLGKEVTTPNGVKDYNTTASMWQLTLGFRIF